MFQGVYFLILKRYKLSCLVLYVKIGLKPPTVGATNRQKYTTDTVKCTAMILRTDAELELLNGA